MGLVGVWSREDRAFKAGPRSAQVTAAWSWISNNGPEDPLSMPTAKWENEIRRARQVGCSVWGRFFFAYRWTLCKMACDTCSCPIEFSRPELIILTTVNLFIKYMLCDGHRAGHCTHDFTYSVWQVCYSHLQMRKPKLRDFTGLVQNSMSYWVKEIVFGELTQSLFF